MRIRMLCEVWRDWAGNVKFTATLGDGSPIEAVGRPHRGVCEVHSTRGIENRHSTELVLCEEIELQTDDSQITSNECESE